MEAGYEVFPLGGINGTLQIYKSSVGQSASRLAIGYEGSLVDDL